jgi:uncharacterized protein (DUF885 family)
MKGTWLATIALAALAACAPSQQNGNANAGNDTAAIPYGPGGATTPNPDWTPFVDSFINGWFKLDPAFAVYQGKHEFDGQLPDWSAAGLKRQADYLNTAITKAEEFSDASLTPQQRFERDYVLAVARGKLFWLTDADQPYTNPAYYVGGGLDPNVYLARNYADLPTRMKAVIRLFDNVPAAAANIRANLKTPMPKSFVDFGVAAFSGFADFYAHDAGQAFAGVKDAALQQQFAASSAKASQAMRDIATWLESQRGSATTDFALGADRFARMLKATELVDVPLGELEAIGKRDLAKNQAALKDACATYAAGATIEACVKKMQDDKPEGGPVEAARRQIPELKQFVVSHDLVTIPGTEEAKVEEAPPYNRQNSAYIDPPGPFDKGIPSVYYIAPPDPAWPAQMQHDFIPGKDDLLFTTVHEVMPGHFVQFLHANRSPSIFGQLFVGYAYAEGWAHYAEQMMWDAGLGNGDPEVHIGQLSNALLRDCRFLSAIGMHAKGMTQAQSEQMFETQCHQDKGNAEQQAARGTYDPAYLNYTMGKLMIMKLREDWTSSRGGRKAWKAFHDTFLSYGGPPIPLVRQAMMDEPQAKAVF